MAKYYIDTQNIETTIEKLVELSNDFPDFAGEVLKKEAIKLRDEIVENAPGDGTSKRALAKKSSYSVSEPKGYGADQYVEVSARSPHFHLVERGHRIVNRNFEQVGYKEGEYYMNYVIDTHEIDEEELAENLIDFIEEALF